METASGPHPCTCGDFHTVSRALWREKEFPNFASSTNSEPITNRDSQVLVPTTESDTATPRRYPSRGQQPPDWFSF